MGVQRKILGGRVLLGETATPTTYFRSNPVIC
jgi:hypothetical protein